MTFIVQRTVRGRENRAVGSPAGRENMVGGNAPPLQPIVTGELGSTVSTTITRATNTATASATSHGFTVGDIVRVAGADQAEFNGDKQVLTVADANTFTYAVYGETVTTPATGTITSRLVLNKPHV